MNAQDIIKKSFLEQFTSNVSTVTVLTALLCTAVLGTYVFFVYQLVCRKSFYSKSFAVSLTVIAMITASIILTIQSSIVISLGMVGALSIVRFRTAVKDPMDLAFLFWSISIGIICGAGIYEIAFEGSILITIVMMFLHFLPNPKPALILLVNCNNIDAEDPLVQTLKDLNIRYIVKSRNISSSKLDIVFELKTKEEARLIKTLSAIEHVYNVTLMTHDGEISY